MFLLYERTLLQEQSTTRIKKQLINVGRRNNNKYLNLDLSTSHFYPASFQLLDK